MPKDQDKNAGKDPAGSKWKYDLYFPHKAGARNDPKLVKVFLKFKYHGVGVYWALMEILREQPEYKYPTEDLDALAHSMALELSDLDLLVTLFVKVGLLKKEAGFYYSSGLLDNMKRMKEKSEKARASVAVRWDKTKSERNTNVQRSNNDSNTVGDTTVIQVKNSKVNPSKEGLSLLDNLSVPNPAAEPPDEALRSLVSGWPFESPEERQKAEELIGKVLPSWYPEVTNELNEDTIEERITYVREAYPGGIIDFLQEKTRAK